MADAMKIGIIGCGNISQAYFRGAGMFKSITVKACADLIHETAEKKAAENHVEAMSIKELLADDEIELVINLTIPKAHAQVSRDILNAGKHVYVEKPLAIDLDEAKTVLELAAKKKLRVGCAPDTILGAGQQTTRKLVDDGWIGDPVAGTAFMMGHGPEKWHPNPDFFYQIGGGPMLDMGPYYIASLVNLLGPVKRVTAFTKKSFPERIATSEMHFGKRIPVEVETHNAGVLEFVSGALVTMTISFDIWAHGHGPIEIYGSEGSLKVPDPNTFGNAVMVKRHDAQDWVQSAYTHNYPENSRGIGVADMATAIRSGRDHRCSGERALHSLEVMKAFELSSKKGAPVTIENACTRPAAFPLGLTVGLLDE